MNNSTKLKKPTIGNYMKAAQSREVGMAVIVGKDELKGFEIDKPKRLPFTKFARFDSSMNVFDIMTALNGPERRVLSEMSHSLAWPDYVASVSFKGLTSNQRRAKNKTLRSLIKRDLIRKIATGRYMFNPEFVLQSRHIEEQAAVREWAHHSSP